MLLCYIPQVWAECVDLGHIIFGLAVPQALRFAPLQEAYPRNEAKKLKRLTTALCTDNLNYPRSNSGRYNLVLLI